VCNNPLSELFCFGKIVADCAENLPGLKHTTEDTDYLVYDKIVVGEHSMGDEAGPVRAGGAHRRENVGMSNRKADENSAPRKSKGSFAM